MKKTELKFIYNSEKKSDREAFGLLKALNRHIINDLDIRHNAMTPTQLVELANKLRVRIDVLFDTTLDIYTKSIESISDKDKLTLINANMAFLKTPIIINEDGFATVLLSPFSVHPIDMAIDGIQNNTR
jgi:arsenate reductase-like glutaredoxin family protein